VPSPSRRRALAATVAAPALVGLGAAALARRVRGAFVGARGFADSRVEGAAFPRRLIDPAGVEHVLLQPPVRIVSTYLACEENLAALVPVERVAAISVYADDPSASNCLGVYPPRVTRLRSDPEPVVAARPDLVCISGFNETDSVRLLAGAGLPLLRQSRMDSFADMVAGLRLLGAAVGQDARAAALASGVEAQLDDLERRLAGVRPVRVLYYDPPGYTMGEGTLVDEILRRAGGRNVAIELGIRGPGQVGLEALLALQPAGRVHEIPGAWINTVSHHAARGLARVARLLHPEAFAT
jgi:iron complex transport system substrate-binding protein